MEKVGKLTIYGKTISYIYVNLPIIDFPGTVYLVVDFYPITFPPPPPCAWLTQMYTKVTTRIVHF